MLINDIFNCYKAKRLTRAEHDAIAERDYKEWDDMYSKLITDISNNPQYAEQIKGTTMITDVSNAGE